MQADLHVHSRHSTRPSQWFLQKIGCPESFTEPLHLYHIARRRGMTLVTITDHNKIEGALEIAHLPGTFISEEVTSYFPEDGCKVHVLVYNITEAQHADIQKLRPNIFDFVGYLKKAAITCAVAHPLYAVNDRLTPDHFEKLLLLFKIFELNGDSSPVSNRCIEEILARLTREDIEVLANKHNIAPFWSEPWTKYLIGGSDDHSSLSIACNYTRVPDAASAAEFLDGIARGLAEAVQRPSSPQNVAHNLYSIAYQFYRHKLDLGQQVPHDFLLRYVDRSLRCTGEEDTRLLSRLHLLWQYSRLRKIKGSIPGPLVDLLKKESSRLIARRTRPVRAAPERRPGFSAFRGSMVSVHQQDVQPDPARVRQPPHGSYFRGESFQHLSHDRIRRRVLHAAGTLLRGVCPSQRATQARTLGHGPSMPNACRRAEHCLRRFRR